MKPKVKYAIVDQIDYYTGKTYVFQGGRYACIGRRSEAKLYNSEKVANNAADALNRRCDGVFHVIKVTE